MSLLQNNTDALNRLRRCSREELEAVFGSMEPVTGAVVGALYNADTEGMKNILLHGNPAGVIRRLTEKDWWLGGNFLLFGAQMDFLPGMAVRMGHWPDHYGAGRIFRSGNAAFANCRCHAGGCVVCRRISEYCAESDAGFSGQASETIKKRCV